MIRPLVLAGTALLLGCAPTEDDVVVFAAASVSDVARDAADRLEAVGEGGAVVSVGASSTLARQIARGAPADVFLSADPDWVNWLAEQGVRGERATLATGRLVWVEPAGTPPRQSLLEAVGSATRVALGDPSHVPSGRYARAALEAADLWAGLDRRLIPQADVRAALAAVETGAADAAVVYASDARVSDRVVVTASVPTPVPIRFEGVALSPRGGPFLRALRDSAGLRLWAASGFGPEVP